MTRRAMQGSAQAGSSVAEFVIIAPLVTLLALAAHDLNKRAEDAQTVPIVARNAAYLGNVGGDGAWARAAALTALTGHAAVAVSGPRALTDEDHGLIRQAPDLKPVAGAFADVYQASTAAIDAALPAMRQATERYGRVLSLTGLDARDNMRRAEVEIRHTGAESAVARSIALLGDMVGGDGRAPLGKRFVSRWHLLSQSAYHASEYRDGALVGAGLGALLDDRWGASGGFSGSSTHLQTRCMSRLSMEPSCETAQPVEETSREFLMRLRALAAAKLTLSTVMAFGTLGIGATYEEALYAALKAEVDGFVADLGGNAVQAGASMIRDYGGERADAFAASLGPAAVRDFTRFGRDLRPAGVPPQGRVGE